MFYSFLRVLGHILLMPVFFIKVTGRKNFRVESGAVIIAHHTSNWDPIILGMVQWYKPVCYIAKEELYKKPLARFFLRLLMTIPIARGKGDLAAVKAALAALKEGKVLGIFPEGTRSTDGSVLPFGQGAALMSMRAGVPVIPVFIKGGYRPFRRIRVFVDPPIDLKSIVGEKTNSKSLNEATQYLHDKIVEMSGRE